MRAQGLAGQVLDGQYILEVPVQSLPVPDHVLDAAAERSITIRDIEGHVYQREPAVDAGAGRASAGGCRRGRAGTYAFVEDPQLGRVTPETEQMLDEHPDLRRALAENPRAARALKLCRSFCFPENANPAQVARLERLFAEMDSAGLDVIANQPLREYLYAGRANLDGAIDGLEGALERLRPPASAAGAVQGRPAPDALQRELERLRQGVVAPASARPGAAAEPATAAAQPAAPAQPSVTVEAPATAQPAATGQPAVVSSELVPPEPAPSPATPAPAPAQAPAATEGVSPFTPAQQAERQARIAELDARAATFEEPIQRLRSQVEEIDRQLERLRRAANTARQQRVVTDDARRLLNELERSRTPLADAVREARRARTGGGRPRFREDEIVDAALGRRIHGSGGRGQPDQARARPPTRWAVGGAA